MTDAISGLKRLRKRCEYRLAEAKRSWETNVEAIRKNPNQMNVHGVWLSATFAEMQALRVVILAREEMLRDIDEEVALLERSGG